MKKGILIFSGFLMFIFFSFVFANDQLIHFQFEEAARYYFCHSVEDQPSFFVSEASKPLKDVMEVSDKAVQLIGKKTKYVYWRASSTEYFITYPETLDSSRKYVMCISLIYNEKGDDGKEVLRCQYVQPTVYSAIAKKVTEGTVEIPKSPIDYLKKQKRSTFPEKMFVDGMKKYLTENNVNGEQTFIVGPYTNLDNFINVYWKNRNEIIRFVNFPEQEFDLLNDPSIQFEKLDSTKNVTSNEEYVLYESLFDKTSIANCTQDGSIISINP